MDDGVSKDEHEDQVGIARAAASPPAFGGIPHDLLVSYTEHSTDGASFPSGGSGGFDSAEDASDGD